MIKCEDVYVLKTGLFLNRMRMHEGATAKFLIKDDKGFCDINGYYVTLFKTKKEILDLNGDFVLCDFYGENALLYKLYDENNKKINIMDIFGVEAFDIASYRNTDLFYKLIIKKLFKPFRVEFVFRDKKYSMSAYKGLDYVGIEKQLFVRSGYSLSMLKNIENYFSILQGRKDKTKKCEYKNADSQKLEEFEM